MRFRPLLCCERGTAAVEFAIVSVLLIVLIIGGIDVGRAFYIKNQLSFLADETVRRVLFDPYVSAAQVASELSSDFNAGDSSQLSVSLSYQVFAQTDFRVIEISYPMSTFIPYLNTSSFTLTVNRRVPLI